MLYKFIALLLLLSTTQAEDSYKSKAALDFENTLRAEFAKYAVARANLERDLWSHFLSELPEHKDFIEAHIKYFTQLPGDIQQENLSNTEFADKFATHDENSGFLDLVVEIKKTKSKADVHELVKKDIFKQYLKDLKAANNVYDDNLKNKWQEIYKNAPANELSEFSDIDKSFGEEHWPFALAKIVKFFELKAWYKAMPIDSI